MAFVVSSLADYTKQNADQLISSSVLGAKTATLIKAQGTIEVGVKSAQTLNIMDTDAIFQDGTDCGFSPSGSTSFTQRVLSVSPIKVHESLCVKKLEKKYLQEALSAGSQYDSFAFAEALTGRKIAKIQAQLEKAIWLGDTDSTDVNLNKFDGFKKIITGAGTAVINANSSTYFGTPATSITATNVVAIFDAIYKAIPAEVIDAEDQRIFAGGDVFRTYMLALKNANMYHYTADVSANGEFTLPGTTIKVISTPGLNGANAIYAMRVSNMAIGVDLLDEEDKVELFYRKEAMDVAFVAEFKYGVQVAFPSEIVKFVV
jgi:hypothetical protein